MGVLGLGWSLLRRMPPLLAWRILHSTPATLLDAIAKVEGRPRYADEYSMEFLGVKLGNPIGLAAGMDKDGRLVWVSWSIGFGFHVVGSVLPEPNPGVEPKILVRMPDGGTINRLGLPSPGVDRVVANLRERRPPGMPVVGSIAAFTPEGYRIVYEKLARYVDWIEVNVSCPNVREHSTFESPEAIRGICRHIGLLEKPALLKIPPTDDPDRLREYIDVARACGFTGIVAANTRKVLYKGYSAGLGGPKLYGTVKRMIGVLREEAPSHFKLVAVGGIDEPWKAIELFERGADLVEVLSCLVHRGPAAVREMLRGLKPSHT